MNTNQTYEAFAIYRKYTDGRIVKVATVATFNDVIAAKTIMVGTGFTIVHGTVQVDFDPASANHLQ